MSVAASAEILGWILVHFSWQGLTIGCLLFLLLACIRKNHSRVRYSVCCAGILLLAMAPIASAFFVLPAVEAPVAYARSGPGTGLDSSPEDAAFEHPAGQDGFVLRGKLEDAPMAVEPAVVRQLVEQQDPRWALQVRAWLPWIVVCWLAGVTLLMIRLLCGLYRVRLWRRDAPEPYGSGDGIW